MRIEMRNLPMLVTLTLATSASAYLFAIGAMATEHWILSMLFLVLVLSNVVITIFAWTDYICYRRREKRRRREMDEEWFNPDLEIGNDNDWLDLLDDD